MKNRTKWLWLLAQRRRKKRAGGVSYLVWGFLRHEQPTFVQQGDEVVAQIAWDALLEWECAGMGGSRTVTVPPFTDPLPDPLPLPT